MAWSIPAEATTASSWNTSMFTSTGGTFTGDPVPGTVYYVPGDAYNLYAYTISFDGDIAVNFYMELSAWALQDDSAHMLFTLPNGKIEQVLVSDARTREIDGKTYYIFTARVAAKEMTDTIKAQMVTSSGAGEEYTYTVEQYAKYIIEHPDSYSAESVALVKAMLNYGTAAQTYFNHNTENAANRSLTAEEQVIAEITADWSTYQKATSGAVEGLTYYGTSAVFETTTVIRHYFTLADGANITDYTFTVGGEKLAPVLSGTMYYVDIPDIAASKLDESYVLTVTRAGADGEMTLTYSVYSYIHDIIHDVVKEYSDNMKNLARAAYWYNIAANAYFAK